MIQVDIVTPDGMVHEGKALSVSLPTPMGEITVMPHHSTLMTIVSAGTVVVRLNKEEHLFAVSRGIAEIDGTRVRLLTDTADRAEELEQEQIEKAKEAAVKLMTERRQDVEGYAQALAVFERETARLGVVRRHRARRPSSRPLGS